MKFIKLTVASASYLLLTSASTKADIATERLNWTELVARVVKAGTTESASRRVALEIDGCQVIANIEQRYKQHGWMLHARWIFDLREVELVKTPKSPDGALFLHRAEQGPNWGLVQIHAIPPYKIQLEIPSYRKTNQVVRRSDRVATLDYYFMEQEKFSFPIEDPKSQFQVSEFARGLSRIRHDYCMGYID